MKEKTPIWKRSKVLFAVSTIILMILAIIFGEKFTPQYQDLTKQILIVGIVLITGHTITDITAMVRKEK